MRNLALKSVEHKYLTCRIERYTDKHSGKESHGGKRIGNRQEGDWWSEKGGRGEKGQKGESGDGGRGGVKAQVVLWEKGSHKNQQTGFIFFLAVRMQRLELLTV